MSIAHVMFEGLESKLFFAKTPSLLFYVSETVKYDIWNNATNVAYPINYTKTDRGTTAKVSSGTQAFDDGSRSFTGHGFVTARATDSTSGHVTISGGMRTTLTVSPGGGIFAGVGESTGSFSVYVLGNAGRQMEMTVNTSFSLSGSNTIDGSRPLPDAYSPFSDRRLSGEETFYGKTINDSVVYKGRTYHRAEFSNVGLSSSLKKHLGYSNISQAVPGTMTSRGVYISEFDIKEIAPVLKVEPSSVNFGELKYGRSKFMRVTVTNAGALKSVLTGSLSELMKKTPADLPFHYRSVDRSFSLKGGESQRFSFEAVKTGHAFGIHRANIVV
ncbi:MAG: hypothetical protein H7144_08680, partial [Burkholderiales bacterium]|nr:hypothetical protein [Phycisphaerae bacterium]